MMHWKSAAAQGAPNALYPAHLNADALPRSTREIGLRILQNMLHASKCDL